jgi:hypothetical protein
MLFFDPRRSPSECHLLSYLPLPAPVIVELFTVLAMFHPCPIILLLARSDGSWTEGFVLFAAKVLAVALTTLPNLAHVTVMITVDDMFMLHSV